MNTTRKGNKLEDQVYALFFELISEGRFFAKSECCEIFKKKGYYSKDREKEIIFDASIEITLPGQSKYSLLVLIECKNYDHRVPVDDVEEFFAKAQQISPSNTKSIIVSTNAFQEGAFNFARSKGIGLLRYFHPETLDWVLTRSPSSITPWSVSQTYSFSAHHGLHSQEYVSRYFDCYGYAVDIYTNSLNQFFSKLIRFDADPSLAESLAEIECGFKPNSYLVPYMESERIEALCREVLQKAGYDGGVAPIAEIYESLSNERGLLVKRGASLAIGVLGVISFNPPIIKVDEDQAGNLERIRFTYAHELGHFLLDHQRYMKRETCHELDVDLENPQQIGIKDILRMEWQANYFASCLLLPADRLIKSFLLEVAKHSLVDRGYGLLYLDEQQCNLNAFYAVTMPIMTEFKVSRSVVKIRLKQLGLLTESESNKFIQPARNTLRVFRSANE